MTNTDPEYDVRAFLTGAAGGPQPPMRLDAADVIERGGQVRRRRKHWAIAGTSTATAVILAVAGFLAGHRAGPPDPVQPAGPGLSTVGTPSPEPTSEVPATSLPASPVAVPGRSAPLTSPRSLVPSAGTRPSSRPSPTTTRSPSDPVRTRSADQPTISAG